MTTAVNLSPRMHAGAPAPQDTRRECRLSSDYRSELMQAGAQQVKHTQTPAEREFARYDRDPKAKAWFWRAVLLPMALWGVVAAVRALLGVAS